MCCETTDDAWKNRVADVEGLDWGKWTSALIREKKNLSNWHFLADLEILQVVS